MLTDVSSKQRDIKGHYIVEHNNIPYVKICIEAAGGVGH